MIKRLLLCMVMSMLVFGVATSPKEVRAQTNRAAVVHSNLDKILSSSEFDTREPQLDPIAKAWRWVGDKVSTFFRWLGKLFRVNVGGVGGGGIFGLLFYWTLLAALATGMVWLAIKVLAGRRAKLSRSQLGLSILTTHELLEQISDPDELMRLADELAGKGEFRLAYRAVYLANLHRLDVKGYIKFDSSTTNGEYIRNLAVAGPKPLFRAITLDFDRSWYGNREIREHEFRNFRALSGQLWSGLEDQFAKPT